MHWFHRHRQHGKDNWFARFMLRRIGRKLSLNAQQQDQLAQLHGKLHEVHADVHEVKRATHKEVEALLGSEQLDREQALRLLAVPKRAFEEKLPEMVDSFADLFNSLDPAQRERMLQLWHRHQRCHGVRA